MTGPDLRRRIADTLRAHIHRSGFDTDCTCGAEGIFDWDDYADHVADVLAAALTPDPSTVAEALMAVDKPQTFSQQSGEYYRKLAQAAIDAGVTRPAPPDLDTVADAICLIANGCHLTELEPDFRRDIMRQYAQAAINTITGGNTPK